MTIYNINLGIGWASSGVEYAQAYRSNVLKKLKVTSKFIFMDFISQDNIGDLTRNIGFEDNDIIWLYTFFTNQKISPTTLRLESLKNFLMTDITSEEREGNFVKLYSSSKDIILNIKLKDVSEELVHSVEYVKNGNLIRKDFYTYIKSFTEYYVPKNGVAQIYLRRFYNEDGSVGLEEIIDTESVIYRVKENIFYSKEHFIEYFMDCLQLKSSDIVILDRSTGTGQAVFKMVKPAKLGVVIHAEHFSENAVTDSTILWNNYYEYQFTNADKVDFFITSTHKQKEVLESQFRQYTHHTPNIYAVPVGSISQLRKPQAERKSFSLVTASRLALEKHVDWLVRAVIEAKKVLAELTFDIYGAGGEEEKIRQIIRKNEAEDYIRLCGHKNLIDVYVDYQIYLTASKSEGFGLTLLEAVGSGLSLIGFDVRYGNQTFIRPEENGYLIPAPDNDDEKWIVSQYAEKIIQIFTTANLEAMQLTSYDIAKDYLDACIEEKWKELIEEVTK